LISLVDFYENNCTEPVIPPGPTPNPDRPKREREIREVKEARTPEKIEKSLGFKNETPLPKNAPIAFVEPNTKIDIANVKAVEIAPTANVKVTTKAGEALQISLKSESKEPVELWVKSPDGSWLLAGVITFDKDGKAILPPLQFKSVGDYSLVLSKPSADSAKGSAPLNQTGSLLVAVS
jgi:glutamyl/glutaminyl-tRNA synthetase